MNTFDQFVSALQSLAEDVAVEVADAAEAHDQDDLEFLDWRVSEMVKAWRAVCEEHGVRQVGRRRYPLTAQHAKQLIDGGMSKSAVAKKFKISRTTLYKLLRESS